METITATPGSKSAASLKTGVGVLLALIAVILLGAALRLYQIGSKTIWLDEAFSIWLGWQPLQEMIRLIIDIDQHPPLYYILLHFWMRAGGFSAAWTRGFSALVSILTIPAIYLLGKQLADSKVGVLAALVLAISPFQVSYGQEARTYALLTFTATVSMWLTARLLSDPRSASAEIGAQLAGFVKNWRSAPTMQRWLPVHTISTDLTWAGYILFTAAVVYLHNTAFFFPVALNLFVFGLMLYRRWVPGNGSGIQPPSLNNWFLAQVGVFLLWSPWIAAFVAQALSVNQEFWIPKPTLAIVLDTFKMFLSAYLPWQAGWLGDIWLVFMGLIALGIIYFRKRLPAMLFLGLIFLTPVVGQLLVSIQRPIFYVRTLIWAPIPVYVLIAAGIRQLRYRPYQAAALALLVATNGLSLQNYYRYYEKERWDQAAAYVNEKVQKEDILLFNAGWVQIPFDYYFRQYNHNVKKYGIPATLFERGVLEPIMAKSDLPRLRSILKGRQRVWLIYSHNWYTDPQALIPAALRQEMRLTERRQFNGVEVYLFGSR